MRNQCSTARMRLTVLTLAISGALAAGIATAQTAASKPASAAMAAPSAQDQKFVTTAAEAGASEVAMGKLASDHASSSDVKGFGARMVSDHQQAGDKLKSIATAKGMSPSDQLSKKDQAELDKLGKLKGSDFDKEYVKVQVSAHKDAVALFGSESKSGKDADLKQFAATTLPTLQDHLQMIQQLSKAPKS